MKHRLAGLSCAFCASLLGACTDSSAPEAEPEQDAMVQSEILQGSVSDAMIPLDQLRSESVRDASEADASEADASEDGSVAGAGQP